MSDRASIKVNTGKVCSVIALALGGAGAVLAVVSLVLYFALGEGKERYTDLNGFLNWHALLTLCVLPFAIVAALCGRVRLGALAFVICFASWMVTTVLVIWCFHGDRPPPSWRASQTPNNSPEPTPVGAVSSASRFTVSGPARLSFLR
jgi:hypothetical protein